LNAKTLFILIFFYCIHVKAQTDFLPRYPKVGKCYVKNFDYNKKFEWQEIHCDSVKKANSTFSKSQIDKFEIERKKMISYQKKLKTMGYKLNVTGHLDNETVVAHHRYLKATKRKERKKRRQEKRNNKS